MGGWVPHPFDIFTKGWGKRWFAVLTVAAVAMLVAFTVHRALTPAALIVTAAPATIPADGFTSAEFTVRSSGRRDLEGLRVAVDDLHRARV
jgi:hypothetical protein